MKTRFYLFLFLLHFIAGLAVCQTPPPSYAIVMHGGAGNITPESIATDKEREIRKAIEKALRKGEEILRSGGTAVDAVEKAIMFLEDSPHFNAGKGAVFTFDGTNDLDASIMDGQNLGAGAVAGVQTLRNPISAARAVMERSPHVMLSGKGAEKFAEAQGLVTVPPDYFRTEDNYNKLLKRKKEIKESDTKGSIDPEYPDHKFGTVGVVALDSKGHLAAGTSTGGMTAKRWGRIGDSPLIGAGTYADDRTCAVSCTGSGEYFIRTVAAHRVSDLVELKGMGLIEAAEQVINKEIRPLGGEGGLIVLNTKGEHAFVFNTLGMYRGYIKEGEGPVVKMFGDE